MIHCPIDKVRFIDHNAVTDPHLVHCVELSDARSIRQFVTIWVKNRDRGERWRTPTRLGTHHDRAVYHRDEAWIPDVFPGKEAAWITHYHLDLDRPPEWNDIVPFADEIPECIQNDLQDYLQSVRR